MIDVRVLGKSKRLAIIAHRGASWAAHENTMEAFELAVTEGADLLELDVRKTVDNVLVVHHDGNIRGASKPIMESTYDEARAQALASSYELSTLDDVMIAFAERIALDIEIKERGIERDLFELVLKRSDETRTLLKSFDPAVVETLSQLAPDFMVGLVVGRDGRKRSDHLGELFRDDYIRRMGASFVAVDWQLLDTEVVASAHSVGLAVLAWTVDDVTTAGSLIAQGVDGIITNSPGLMAGIVENPEPD